MKKIVPLLDRLWKYVAPEPNTGCWLWYGSAQKLGYGTIKVDGRALLAHRVMYEAMRGPIPVGLTIDHLCRVPACVNPDHLEPVTQQVNVLRGRAMAALASYYAALTHCRRGHPYDEKNTYRRKDGYRNCRRCDAENRQRYRREAREHRKP